MQRLHAVFVVRVGACRAWGGRVPKPTYVRVGRCVLNVRVYRRRKQIHLISSSFPASLDSGNQSRRSLHTPAQRSASVYIYLPPHLNPPTTPNRRPNQTSRGVRAAMATDEPLGASPLASLLICHPTPFIYLITSITVTRSWLFDEFSGQDTGAAGK